MTGLAREDDARTDGLEGDAVQRHAPAREAHDRAGREALALEGRTAGTGNQAPAPTADREDRVSRDVAGREEEGDGIGVLTGVARVAAAVAARTVRGDRQATEV